MMTPVKNVGPLLTHAQHKVFKKVIEFTSQVWINCAKQTNMYDSPCGDMFSKIAKNIQKIMTDNQFKHPSSFFYTLGLEFGSFIDHSIYGEIGAICSIVFINVGIFLEAANKFDFYVMRKSLIDSLSKVEKLSGNSVIMCLNSGIKELQKISSYGEILKYLEAAAFKAEKYAMDHVVGGKKVAGLHVVGITLRSIFQAVKVTL